MHEQTEVKIRLELYNYTLGLMFDIKAVNKEVIVEGPLKKIAHEKTEEIYDKLRKYFK